MYRYLLFDLDGTLTDPAEGITKSVQYALHKCGIETPAASLTEFIGPPLLEQFMSYAHLDRKGGEQAVEWYRERYRPIGIYENRVYDGIPALLEKLQNDGKILCIASSKPEVFVKQICIHYGLDRYFTVMAGSDLAGNRTAKDMVIADALERLGVPDDRRGEAVMIGDRKHDAAGARKIGIPCIGVRWGFAPAGELEAEAVPIADTPDALYAMLNG